MSKWIGHRVSYPCLGCGEQITLSAKCIETDDGVYCPKCAPANKACSGLAVRAKKQLARGERITFSDERPANR